MKKKTQDGSEIPVMFFNFPAPYTSTADWRSSGVMGRAMQVIEGRGLRTGSHTLRKFSSAHGLLYSFVSLGKKTVIGFSAW